MSGETGTPRICQNRSPTRGLLASFLSPIARPNSLGAESLLAPLSWCFAADTECFGKRCRRSMLLQGWRPVFLTAAKPQLSVAFESLLFSAWLTRFDLGCESRWPHNGLGEVLLWNKIPNLHRGYHRVGDCDHHFHHSCDGWRFSQLMVTRTHLTCRLPFSHPPCILPMKEVTEERNFSSCV